MAEVLIKLDKIYRTAEKSAPGQTLTFDRPFNLSPDVNNIIHGYEILQDGKEFKSKVAQMKLNLLMASQKASSVTQYGKLFSTNSKMYVTTFKRVAKADDNLEIIVTSLKTDKMIGLKNLTTGKALDLDYQLLMKGRKNSLVLKKDDEYEIQWPIAPNNVYMSGKLANRGNDKAVIELDRYTIQDKVTINAFHVRARHHQSLPHIIVWQDRPLLGNDIPPSGGSQLDRN